ncbi:hypothetical protein Avbf_09901, partial [Armadillidium vulgare]
MIIVLIYDRDDGLYVDIYFNNKCLKKILSNNILFLKVLCCETLDILSCEPIPAYLTKPSTYHSKGSKRGTHLHPCPTKSKY